MESTLPTGYRAGLAFHLPQSSLKRVHAVIRAYFAIGRPATLQEVAEESEQPQKSIRDMQDFLADMGILRGASRRKQLRPLGMDLGKAIKSHKGDAAVNRIWKRAVCQNGFCIQVLRDARLEGKVDKNRFIYLIFTAAGHRPRDLSHAYTTGTKSLISVFRRAGLVRRTNGYFTVSKAVERLPESVQEAIKRGDDYISREHIAQLEEMQLQATAGLSHLLGYCSEINDNYRRGNVLSVRLLCNAILDHVMQALGHATLESLAADGSETDLREAAGRLLAVRALQDGQVTEAHSSEETVVRSVEPECKADMNLLVRCAIELIQDHGTARP
jgi:hypothetical protein